ncbi:hypothetical protein TNCV_4335711 [Trichonephila clavipes]|uniref:Uncharacterized protein n=1 Tax=Trichonephila clavipes TaxID=2585209 RepID=A0A8X6UWM4_TRICX|nr:hypothetical protein TNCV_4335711 [Trichonephila clavipes]
MEDSWKTRGGPIIGYLLWGLADFEKCGVHTLWKQFAEREAVVRRPGQGRKRRMIGGWFPLVMCRDSVWTETRDEFSFGENPEVDVSPLTVSKS